MRLSGDGVERWWASYCRSGPTGGGAGRAMVGDGSLLDDAADARVVHSAEALVEAPAGRPVIWHARPARRLGSHTGIVEELCWDGTTGWRPWETDREPYDTTPLVYRRMSDALLFVRSGLVMPSPFTALRETRPDWADMLEPIPGGTEVAAEPPVIDLGYARPKYALDGPLLSLCHVYGHGYGHWFADALPPLLNLLAPVLDRRLRIVVPPLLPWQRRSLELLGVPPGAVVEVGEATVGCRDLVCHSFGGKAHAIRSGPVLSEVYRRLSPATPGDEGAPRLIYVSRSALGSWRDFANEADVESALAAAGFTVIHPERMTLDQQIARFSRAEVVAGAHGSALANAGFAPSGCLIVTIVPEGIRHHWVYGLARHLRHRLLVLVAPRDRAVPGEDAPKFFAPMRYRVPADEVVARTLAAMERCGIARPMAPAPAQNSSSSRSI